MFRYRKLVPENAWGVFDKSGYCVAIFGTAAEASDYCARHNANAS